MARKLDRKKLGVQLDPPALLLLYAEAGVNKKRTMPIRDLSRDADCLQLAQRMAARHQAHLGPLNIVTLQKMIRIVQEHLRGVSVSESLVILQQEFQINPAEDLNKLSDKELKHRKAIMDLSFEKNRLDRDHPYFVYDKEVEFSGSKKATDWDSGESQNNSADSTPVNSPVRRVQPLLPAARKGLFGLEEEADVVAPPADPQPVGSGISGGPCPPEEAKSEPSVSCGEPGGDTDSDFW